jgi:hypothetical protein
MKITIAVNVGRNTFIKPASHKKSSGHILLLWKARKILSGHVALKSEHIFFYNGFTPLNQNNTNRI